MIAALLIGLLKANLAAGAGVLLVLALRKPVRGWFGARAAYALWLAPLAAAAAVLAPHPRLATPIAPMVLRAQAAAETAAATMADAFVAQAPNAVQASGPDAASLIFGLWVVGALAMAGLVLRRQARFVRAMGRLTASDTPRVFRAESPNVGPAVVGVFRPRIVAPADFEARFGPEERRLILTHEQVHLAAGDAGVNALACAAQCVSWFNPLVHLGVRTLRIDQELACDAAVVGRFPSARRAYAELLLKTQIATQALPLGCHWPAGADHPLKERIAMLKSPLPAGSMRATGLALAAALTLSAGGLAWAAQPAASDGPGPAERAQAQKYLEAHADYSCDPALEAKGVGCKIIRTSTWVAMPTPADVARAYPAGAREAGQTAKVLVKCATTPKGLMTDCAVVHVDVHVPPGEGAPPSVLDDFGNAALQLTRYYQARIYGLPPGPPKSGHATFFVEIGEFNGAVTPVIDTAQPPAFRSMWIKKPTADDIARLYPPTAAAKRLTGDVNMSCRVGPDGRLQACNITRVNVSGVNLPDPAADPDFGAATLELSKLFQMEPTNRSGGTTNGAVIGIPVRWTPPQPKT